MKTKKLDHQIKEKNDVPYSSSFANSAIATTDDKIRIFNNGLLNIPQNELKKIIHKWEAKELKVSYDPDYAPFSKNINGEAVGMFVDIWKLWGEKNGYRIRRFRVVRINTFSSWSFCLFGICYNRCSFYKQYWI